MTPARQRRKPRLALAFVAALGLCVSTGLPPARAGAPVVINPQTGLAISGFDPVAYFTDGRPRIGRADLELRVDGVVWRFVNEGDRAASARVVHKTWNASSSRAERSSASASRASSRSAR